MENNIKSFIDKYGKNHTIRCNDGTYSFFDRDEGIVFYSDGSRISVDDIINAMYDFEDGHYTCTGCGCDFGTNRSDLWHGHYADMCSYYGNGETYAELWDCFLNAVGSGDDIYCRGCVDGYVANDNIA